MAAADLLAQRSPAIRTRSAYSGLSHTPATPGSPHTPLLSRTLSSQYGSPGAYRADDELVVYEFGSRFLRVGFSGEPTPKVIWRFDPSTNRTIGDYTGPGADSGLGLASSDHISDWELWDYDVAGLDLDLVQNRLERALRTINEKHLLLDLKSRSAVVVFRPALPNALVEIVLRTMFTVVNHPRSAFLTSSPILSVLAAGVRSGVVIDMGWSETTITVVYEYREVAQRRTVRGMKYLSSEVENLLHATQRQSVPHDLVENIITRLVRCRPLHDKNVDHERQAAVVRVNADTTVTHNELANVCEAAFLGPTEHGRHYDDHELPLPALLWRVLLALPFDIRGMCMGRLAFTGGGSFIPGLKQRVLDEVDQLIRTSAWDPLHQSTMPAPAEDSEEAKTTAGPYTSDGTKAADQAASSEPLTNDQSQAGAHGVEEPTSTTVEEQDEITTKLQEAALRLNPPPFSAQVRGIETLGAWAGASLMGHLRIEGSIEIKRDEFLKQGMQVLGYPI